MRVVIRLNEFSPFFEIDYRIRNFESSNLGISSYFRGMYYYLIIALQGFCIYHCFANKNQYYWYFVIFFLPVVGSIIYLFMNVFNKRDIDIVQEEIVSIVNPSKKIVDLEKKFKFSDSFENQTALADAYLAAGMHDKAIENYDEALQGTFQNDFYVISKLEEAHYFSSDFEKAIECAERIKNSSKFNKSKASFLYGLALEQQGNISEAEALLSKFDAPYSRYQERLELAKFYIRNVKTDKAKELLNEIAAESEGMSKTSYRQNKILIRKAKELLASEL